MTRWGLLARIAGVTASVVGVALIAVSAYYLVLYMRSGSDADEFNLELSHETRALLTGRTAPKPGVVIAPEVVPFSTEDEVVVAASTDEPAPAQASSSSSGLVTIAQAENAVAPDAVAVASSDVPLASDTARTIAVAPEMFASLHPGGNFNPRYWSEPAWAGNLPFGGPQLPEGFIPVDSADTALAASAGIQIQGVSRGKRIRIPAIQLDATVEELEIKDLGDSRAWSTPDKVVGHIPSTANPGEPRLGWYFGHLDNFISNEGDIFRRLPEISGLLRWDPVDIFIETDEAEYVYRVTGTRQMHRDDLRLTDTNDSQITLVTCWPFRVYDHRILVTASLIAVKPYGDTTVASG